jgi:predicted transposase/invertase (TIGR01784 family)
MAKLFSMKETSHPVDFHLVDRGMNIFDLHNILPEYFMVSIPLFDNVIKQEIDEWLYLIKHSEVKESFKSPYMQKVAQRLNILKMSNAERNIYDSYIMESMKGRDYLVSAKEQGRAEGIQIGKEERMQLAKIEMAKKMLSLNIALDIVAETTGLSMEEVQTLQNE